MKARSPKHRTTKDFPSLKIHKHRSQMGPQVYLVIIVTSLKSFCVGVLTLQNDCHYLLLCFQCPSTHTTTTGLPYCALSRWPHSLSYSLKSSVRWYYTDRTEGTSYKSSPPGQQSSANIFPWAHPPFLPLYHWDEGPLPLNWPCLQMQSSSQPCHCSSLGWGFPASRVSPSLLDHPHHCMSCLGNISSYKDSR